MEAPLLALGLEGVVVHVADGHVHSASSGTDAWKFMTTRRGTEGGGEENTRGDGGVGGPDAQRACVHVRASRACRSPVYVLYTYRHVDQYEHCSPGRAGPPSPQALLGSGRGVVQCAGRGAGGRCVASAAELSFETRFFIKLVSWSYGALGLCNAVVHVEHVHIFKEHLIKC